MSENKDNKNNDNIFIAAHCYFLIFGACGYFLGMSMNHELTGLCFGAVFGFILDKSNEIDKAKNTSNKINKKDEEIKDDKLNNHDEDK